MAYEFQGQQYPISQKQLESGKVIVFQQRELEFAGKIHKVAHEVPVQLYYPTEFDRMIKANGSVNKDKSDRNTFSELGIVAEVIFDPRKPVVAKEEVGDGGDQK